LKKILCFCVNKCIKYHISFLKIYDTEQFNNLITMKESSFIKTFKMYIQQLKKRQVNK